MSKLAATSHPVKKLFIVLLILFVITIQGCYQYRVINTNDDPVTEYEQRVVWSYAWGLVNKPQNLHVPNCTDSTALNEVVYSKNFGQSLLTVVTLGIVSPVKIKWRCHKPCPREIPGL